MSNSIEMKKNEATNKMNTILEVIGLEFKTLKGNVSYIVKYVEVIENPIHSDNFDVYIGTENTESKNILLDTLDVIASRFHQLKIFKR